MNVAAITPGLATGRAAAALVVALVMCLLAPPVRHLLEASMTMQMLVQMPLLAGAGVLLARAIRMYLPSALASWNQGGISSLVLASVSSAFWMLPRALDAAVTDPWVTAAKHVSLPLLVGLPLALAWPGMSFVVKGVFMLEVIATLFRLGWLFLASPDRLCTLYLIDDQQRLGRCLLAAGSVFVLALAWKLLFGRFNALPEPDTRKAEEGWRGSPLRRELQSGRRHARRGRRSSAVG